MISGQIQEEVETRGQGPPKTARSTKRISAIIMVKECTLL